MSSGSLAGSAGSGEASSCAAEPPIAVDSDQRGSRGNVATWPRAQMVLSVRP
jgi:hypothetical protein